MVSVRLSVRRRFCVLIDVMEPAWTVGFEKSDSARTVGFGKRDSENGSRDSEKTSGQTGQGEAGGRAGSVCPSVLQSRAGAK